MTHRETTNKNKVLKYIQRKFKEAKQMDMFKSLRTSVETGANGTQKYMIKRGKNKGTIV